MSDVLLKKALKKFYSEDNQQVLRVSKKKKKKATSSLEKYIESTRNVSDKKDKNIEALLKLSSKKVEKSFTEKVVEKLHPKSDQPLKKSKESTLFSEADFEKFEKEYFISKI